MKMKRVKLSPKTRREQQMYQQQHASRFRKYREEPVDVNWALPCDGRLSPGTVITKGSRLHILLTALRALEAVDGGRAVGTLRKPITSCEALRSRE
jgi:hypothetical protein